MHDGSERRSAPGNHSEPNTTPPCCRPVARLAIRCHIVGVCFLDRLWWLALCPHGGVHSVVVVSLLEAVINNCLIFGFAPKLVIKNQGAVRVNFPAEKAVRIKIFP